MIYTLDNVIDYSYIYIVLKNCIMLYNLSKKNHIFEEGYGKACPGNSFRMYLQQPVDSLFVLDLSESSLIECIDKMIEVKIKMHPNYGKQYSCLKNNLKRIQTEFNVELKPYQITDVFWNNFIPYLLDKGLALSSVKTMCSQLKTAIEWSGKHRARISDTYDIVKIPPYCRKQIALTADEVSHIYHYDISTIKRRNQYIEHMDRVKDMFVLSCNLGQRYSDMVRIDKSCFSRSTFTILQQKTGVKAHVDIDRMAIDRNTTYKILEKYNYRAPTTTDVSCFDRYIKQLLQYIGFDDPIKRDTKINGIIQTKVVPKWSLISSHTARRTFATHNVIRGYRVSEIRRATGHKTETAFEKYLCYYDE